MAVYTNKFLIYTPTRALYGLILMHIYYNLFATFIINLSSTLNLASERVKRVCLAKMKEE